ncbi:pentapeptide repeat-containing protein [Spongiactinospora sp. TRM90649]|uniref:pentapeptide repeat-containing protein n=1 Tax=Spongiactinospora sp. TRM90649 TaxID=3031114 RepID=UPI0023F7FE77|nr:pentapeptide repeat-containing protein [Spongiactinospora sp. TRM90649]MDF5755165.1 pentapeptide repeat-containing protein [Spongiactinospora sp. TRM90649]
MLSEFRDRCAADERPARILNLILDRLRERGLLKRPARLPGGCGPVGCEPESGAYLARAYLFHADPSGANLRRATLRGTTLSGANLDKTDLVGADLRGAYLEDVRGLSEQQIRAVARVDATTRFR